MVKVSAGRKINGTWLIIISRIPYSGDLSLQNEILSFELPVFFYQRLKLIAVMHMAWASAAAIGVVIFAMMEAALAACGSSGRGQVTRVLEPVMRRGASVYTGKTYTGAIVAARRTALGKC
jgi:hypothetical protein